MCHKGDWAGLSKPSTVIWEGSSHVTDDRACGISLTPDPETFPLSAPAVANGWPRTSVTTGHWGSFVWAVNHIRKGHAGVRSETGELWPSGEGLQLWYLGRVCKRIDNRLVERWQIRVIQQSSICMRTDHTDKRRDRRAYNGFCRKKDYLPACCFIANKLSKKMELHSFWKNAIFPSSYHTDTYFDLFYWFTVLRVKWRHTILLTNLRSKLEHSLTAKQQTLD